MGPTEGFSRSWCFTMFNPDDVSRLRDVPHKAFVVAEEICPTTGTTHYQGYIRFEDKKRFSWWKNQFPTVHVEIRKGKEMQARAYIADVAKYNELSGQSKVQGIVLHDYGCQQEKEKTGDAANDVLDMLEAGAPNWQIYREHRVFYFHHCAKIERLRGEMATWERDKRPYKKARSSAASEDSDA